MAVLRILHKQPAEVKARLDVVIIDSQDYHQGGSSLQRLLIHTEKVPFATPSFAESQQHFGSWTRFVHGYVTAISAKNKVRLFEISHFF
jgi:putative effector of murein hydrolase